MTCRLGGVGCTGQTDAIPKALKALSKAGKIIRSFRSLGTMRWPMLNGRVNDYLPKLSVNSPPAAGWNQSATYGVMNSSRAANTWRIPGRDCSRFETVAKTDLWVLRPLAPSQPMATACTTWLATCGNGAATGIGSIATSRLPAKTYVATPGARLRVMIQAIRTLPSALSKEVHSFATPLTARVIARARVEERRPIPVRPIQVSDALSLETTPKLSARLESNLLLQNKHLLTETIPKTNTLQKTNEIQRESSRLRPMRSDRHCCVH